MRTTTLVLSALVALSAIALAMPGGDAVGTCNAVTGHCDGYLVCVGTQTSYGHLTHCEHGIPAPSPCDPCPPPQE